LYYKTDHSLSHGVFLDKQQDKLMEVPQAIKEYFTNNSQLLFNENDIEKEHSGYIENHPDFWLVTMRPILTSDGDGPVNGTLVFGQMFDETKMSKISALVGLEVDKYDIDENYDNPALTKALHYWSSNSFQSEYIDKTEAKTARSFQFARDILGNPTLILETITPRSIYNIGQKTTHEMLWVATISMIICLWVIIIVLEILIMSPIKQLSLEVESSAQLQSTKRKVTESSKDEIGKLARRINALFKQIASSETQIQQTLNDLSNTQFQLVQSQKLESIGKLASGISHDFNNLLGSIMGYASLLIHKFKEDSKTVKKLEIILSSAQKGAKLTKELLGFSRQGKFEKKKINIIETLYEIEKILAPQLKLKGITFNIDCDANIHLIEADPTQLIQVIMNLCINAFDAISSTDGTIKVSVKNEEIKSPQKIFNEIIKAGSYVKINLSDNGQGISENVIHRIFDPFFTTKEVGKGTGLGLSMAFGIIKNHGGYIDVKSQPQQGTHFIIWLPKATNIDKETSVNSIDMKETSQSCLKGKTILVVDDDENMRSLSTDILTQYDAHVILAKDGVEAVKLFTQNLASIDTILLDIIMPKKDGLSTYEEMRKANPHIPIVFASGYAQDTIIQKIKNIENSIFIQKPYDDQTLIQAVSSVT
ncbi:MAG: PAS/PAC sensor hybrid histidine kinase, partial [uncultured bacterium]